MNGEDDIAVTVRLDATGGGATIFAAGEPETYTYAFGNAASLYGTLAMLAGDPGMDGGEEIYKERLRAQLLTEIHNYGVPEALRRVFYITRGDWQ